MRIMMREGVEIIADANVCKTTYHSGHFYEVDQELGMSFVDAGQAYKATKDNVPIIPEPEPAPAPEPDKPMHAGELEALLDPEIGSLTDPTYDGGDE